MIFVDTGAWFALFVTKDINHGQAIDWLAKNRIKLLTTDYIIDELLTLLKARGHTDTAIKIGEQFFVRQQHQIYYLNRDDILESWKVFQQFNDKEWSFTDCTSKVIIEKLSIKSALAFDEHFKQFGTINILPETQ